MSALTAFIFLMTEWRVFSSPTGILKHSRSLRTLMRRWKHCWPRRPAETSSLHRSERQKEKEMKGTKPSIVFCHGLWADGSCFSKLIVPLQAEGYECIAAQYGLNTTAEDI